MTLKSIKKLREAIERKFYKPGEYIAMVDEIEREISDRYMLPVDADGVPWTKEDKTFAYFKDPYDAQEIVEYVYSVKDESWYIKGLSEGCTSEYYALHCVHVKTDPVKELLCEVIHEYISTDALTETIAEKYADKLRKSAATLCSGKLTAEQVRKATYAHSIHADCADADWQAIADELNAAIGGGDAE